MKYNKYIFIAFAIIICVLGALLFQEHSKYSQALIDVQSARIEFELDSINVLNGKINEHNILIESQVIELGQLKDSINVMASKKEVKIEKHKQTKNENIHHIHNADDSTIVNILSDFKFISSNKR